MVTIETKRGRTTLRISQSRDPVKRPTTTKLQRIRAKRLSRGLCRDCGLRPLATKHRCELCQGIERARWNRSRLRYRPTKGKRPTSRLVDYARNLEQMERMGWDVIERIRRRRSNKRQSYK